MSSSSLVTSRGGVEDTRLEAKDTKKIRGQGQGQPFRGQNFSRPRTGMLEAKDTGASVLQKKKRLKFQAISNSLAYPEFLIGGGLNHKSHEMKSSKLFQIGSFCGTKISQNERSEIVVACWHVTRILQRKRASTSS